jgi:hypothetical protein
VFPNLVAGKSWRQIWFDNGPALLRIVNVR